MKKYITITGDNNHQLTKLIRLDNGLWELDGSIIDGDPNYSEVIASDISFDENGKAAIDERNLCRAGVDNNLYGLELKVANSFVDIKGLKSYINILELSRKNKTEELDDSLKILWKENPGNIVFDIGYDKNYGEEERYHLSFKAKNKVRKNWMGEENMEKFAISDSGFYDKDRYSSDESPGHIYIYITEEQLTQYIEDLISEYEEVSDKKYERLEAKEKYEKVSGEAYE